MTEMVLTQRKGKVEWISINRPENRNALNTEVLEGLSTAILAANNDPDARAIVITGAGENTFCAGADLKAEKGISPVKPDMASQHNPLTQLFRAFESCNLPILARVHGNVLAGGMGLLCGCDLAIATDNSKFGLPEVQIGLFPMQILAYMLKLIPRRKLTEICMTGDLFTAHEALSMGLVNYVVPGDQLDDKLDWLIDRIVRHSPIALRHGKNGLHAIQDMTLSQAFSFAEANVARMSATSDATEGYTAFVEKRAPVWRGK